MNEREEFLKKLKQKGIEEDIPNVSLTNALFLRKFLRDTGVKNMLEIGTANGYSTIHFADELESVGGYITTIEFSEDSYNKAMENFKEVGLSPVITQKLGNALQVIPTLQDIYDFVFIDGMKKRSLEFLKLVWDKVPTGGTIIIDDVIKFRHKMVGLYEYVEELGLNYEVKQIDEDDGIMILRK